MKKIFLIVTVLSLVAFTANAQKYGFYGHGASITGRSSYHNGVNGTYIGYHPAGISNSRMTGSTASKRSGYSIATQQVYNSTSGSSVSAVSNSHVTGETAARRSYSGTRTPAARESQSYNPLKSGNSNTLGISTEVFNGFGGSGSGSGSSDFVYGRTGTKEEPNGISFGSTISATIEQLATTTNSDQDGGQTGFMNEFSGTPTYTGASPIGDAILPLLLLLIPVIVMKVRKH